MMIEIFKTNVSNTQQAEWLIEQIHKTFCSYHANFDLSDCDRILRVACNSDSMEPAQFIKWLKSCGCIAEVLPDN